MEGKKVEAGPSPGYPALEVLDQQITGLRKVLLPYEPHLLTVPTSTPYRETSSYEYRGTPFAEHEVRELQHMTMISTSRRGVARAEGDWQARIDSLFPGSLQARSSTHTSHLVEAPRTYKNKVTFSDYANAKKNGTKLPTPPTVAGENRADHARNASASTASTPMSRLPSLDGGAPEVKLNGVAPLTSSQKSEKSVVKEDTRHAVPPSTRPDAKTNGSVVNGVSQRAPNNLIPQKSLSHLKPPLNHQLPPRPRSPPRNSYEMKSLSDHKKRSFESSAAGQPEKRAKIGHDGSPSGSQNAQSSRKNDTSTESKKISPTKSSNPSSTSNRASPLPRKTIPDAKSSQAKEVRNEKPKPLPGRLGPLPEDLTELANPKKTGSQISTPNPPSRYNDHDSVAGKGPRDKGSSRPTTPSQASQGSQASKRMPSSLKPLPKMLSPTLPDVVERELERIQAKKTGKDKEVVKKSPPGRDTVGARYEEVRRPNMPGVARKTPKVGHPPKKAPVESSKSRTLPEKEKTSEEKPSLIVKMKYKKRNATNLQRILRISPKPSSEFLRLEKERQARLNPPRVPKPAPVRRDSSSAEETDRPGASSKASTSKKRPSSTTERSAPAAKRPKLQESVDVPKAKKTLDPPFKSPAPSTKSQTDLLSTPKKDDAIKSVAMRKVVSNDSAVHTPQNMNTSTPASAERPRVNGDARPPPNDKRSEEADRVTQEALTLKRKMDQLLQLKGAGPGSVTENDRKLGLAVGIECVTRYMAAFVMRDRNDRARSVGMWESIVGIWVVVERHTINRYPALHALDVQLGAILKQEIGRAYMESWQRNPQKCAADQAFLPAMMKNTMDCDQHWKDAHKLRSVLADLGAPEALGPWSTVAQATLYIHAVLDLYAKREKTGWKLYSGSSLSSSG